MNTNPYNKKDPVPRNKKDKTGLNKKSAGAPENTTAKLKQEKAAEEEGKMPEDTDMTQYQNIDSGKESSDTERSDNDIEGGDDDIFK